MKYAAELTGVTIRNGKIVQPGTLVGRPGGLDVTFMGGPRDEPWSSRCWGLFWSAGKENRETREGWPCYQLRVGPFHCRLWWPRRNVVLFYDNRTNSLDRVEWEGPE